MKYGVLCGLDPSTTIKNYTKDNDKIIIKYLDGATYELPLTEENEDKVLSKMGIQAQEYVDKMDEVKKSRNGAILFATASLVGTAASIGSFIYDFSFSEVKTMALVGSTISSTCFGTVLVSNLMVLRDMKKYSLYLGERYSIGMHKNNPNILNGLEESDINNININTLDNYTLKDMEILKSNIKRISINSDIYKEEDDVKVFTKKMTN